MKQKKSTSGLLSQAKVLLFVAPRLRVISLDVDRWLQRDSRFLVIAMHSKTIEVKPSSPNLDDGLTPLRARIQHIYVSATTEPTLSDPVILSVSIENEIIIENSFPISAALLESGSAVIIESKPHVDVVDCFGEAFPYLLNKRTLETMRHTLVKFARRLREIDIEKMHVLQAIGILEQPDSFRLVFKFPTGATTPQTLRSLLLADASRPKHPLEQRFTLARHIATGMFYLHAAGYVHKNIRPDTIVLFTPQSDSANGSKYMQGQLLGDAYLTGFTQLRLHSEASLQIGSTAVWDDIYRHPHRKGIKPQSSYEMVHDIYSFGVLLVEIALWDTFVVSKTSRPALGNMFEDMEKKYGRALYRTNRCSAGSDMHEIIVRLAEEDVASRMGQRYAELALECLKTVKTPVGELFGLSEDDVKDKLGTGKVPQCYSAKVVEILENLSLPA
jgi:hypothetical protein